jgi:hypothetical protein
MMEMCGERKWAGNAQRGVWKLTDEACARTSKDMRTEHELDYSCQEYIYYEVKSYSMLYLTGGDVHGAQESRSGFQDFSQHFGRLTDLSLACKESKHELNKYSCSSWGE